MGLVIQLVTFLGNPGTQYRRTRHNAAWVLLEECALFDDLSWQQKFHGSFASIPGGVRFLKPETFMNKSGRSVAAALSFFSLEAENLLVIHDEVELPFGTVSFKSGGGTAGHNGLRSVRESIGTGEFYRFRLGVSRPTRGSVSSYVLSRFSQDEEPRLHDYFQGACRLLAEFLDERDPERGCGRGKITVIPE
jgi:PTH1 family peptidyl-tRNA hydrolase